MSKQKQTKYHILVAEKVKERGAQNIENLSKEEVAKIFCEVNKEFSKVEISDIISHINVELTTRCSSMCKFCGRQLDHVKYKIDLPLETFKKLPIEDLREIRLEGTLGDSIHYPFICEVLKEIRNRRNEKTRVTIFTNGNKYNEEWWSRLAKLLDFHPENRVFFGLDGLADTHALHRSGTDFKKITSNIKAFNEGGGCSEVQMIVFKHNEHQIEELRDFCYKIGCKNFYTRVSKEYDNEFERPEIFKQKSRHEKSVIEKNYNTPIICGMIHTRGGFLTCDGQIIPCFKWHPRRFFWKNDNKETQDVFWENLSYMNLNEYDFYEILENNFLKYLKNNLQNMRECGNICRTLLSDFHSELEKQ